MKPLTKEQLRDNAAAMLAFADGKPIQFNPSANNDPDSIWWDTKDLTYIQTIWHRPKPQPVSRPWGKPEDVPGPVCWLRPKGGGNMLYLITHLSGDGTLGHTLGRIVWSEMVDLYEYSTDRVTWKPCTVEDAQ
jgi:hypothetical protein